jgi:hypothetical protein
LGFHLLHAVMWAYLACGQLALGSIEQTTAAMERGLGHVDNDVGRWCEADLLRVRVATLIANNAADDEIVDGFMRALGTARSQPNRICELRAASDFAHFADGGRHVRLAAQKLKRALASINEPAEILVFRQAKLLAEDLGV